MWDKKVRSIGKTSARYRGKVYRRFKAGYSPSDREVQERTGNKKEFYCECGAKWGGYHELGCDLEDCPICKRQLLSCGHGILFETESVGVR